MKDELYHKIGENIKFYRKRAEISQSSLAEKLKLKRASVSNYEKALQRIPIHTLIDICEILKCELSSMFLEQRRYLINSNGSK